MYMDAHRFVARIKPSGIARYARTAAASAAQLPAVGVKNKKGHQ